MLGVSRCKLVLVSAMHHMTVRAISSSTWLEARIGSKSWKQELEARVGSTSWKQELDIGLAFC